MSHPRTWHRSPVIVRRMTAVSIPLGVAGMLAAVVFLLLPHVSPSLALLTGCAGFTSVICGRAARSRSGGSR